MSAHKRVICKGVSKSEEVRVNVLQTADTRLVFHGVQESKGMKAMRALRQVLTCSCCTPQTKP